MVPPSLVNVSGTNTVKEHDLQTQEYLPTIMTALEHTLNESQLTLQPKNGDTEVSKYVGKVRDRYNTGAEVVLVTTDRLTAFDRPIAKIPFKGAVLNLISEWWFKQTAHIMPNHLLAVPHPNVTIGTAVTPFPVEFVVRAYLTGSSGTSILKHYKDGDRIYCGIQLPDNLKDHQKLDQVLITPTTKSDEHDELLSAEEVVSKGLMSQEEWDYCSQKALELFVFASAEAAKRGLILVDTKMEMGRAANGEILLIDELFTPDSSRYWLAEGAQEAIDAGKQPNNIDKEFVRLWMNAECKKQGTDPYKAEVLPTVPEETVAELSRRYVLLYELITGLKFDFSKVLDVAATNGAIQMAVDGVLTVPTAPAPKPLTALFQLTQANAAKPDRKRKRDERDTYVTPLKRYAPDEISHVWSERNKFRTWRLTWVALAKAQFEMGLSQITADQIRELEEAVDLNDEEFDIAAAKEKEIGHDVMSHVYAYGLRCPLAKPIIHLGATSCYVTCHTELMQMRESMVLIRASLLELLQVFKTFALQYKDLACLGYTHFQAAQLVTVGKRASMWANDIVLALQQLDFQIENLPARGVKGTTGTQATALELFDGDHAKVKALDKLAAEKMGFKKVLPVTGQTYSRSIDHYVLSALSGIGSSLEKMFTDLRLLINHKECDEPRGAKQVGSSAMPYKRNPMLCERGCGLAQHLVALSTEPAITQSKQWLERTLNDSVDRRFVLPEAFMTCDTIVKMASKIISGLEIYPEVIAKNMQDELPFMASELIIIACVKAGGDRQELHAAIHEHSMQAGHRMKTRGAANDLLQRIKEDPLFAAVMNQIDSFTDAALFIGRSPGIVEDFCSEVIDPLLTPENLAKGNQFVLKMF